MFLQVLLNIKEIKFSLEEGIEDAKVKLSKKGPGEIKAGDLQTPAGVEIINKDHLLGTLADKKSKLEVEIWVKSGYGYVPFEERKSAKRGVFPIDSVFSPVTRANYEVEKTRVGQVTNLDKLILEIWTDGTVKPKEAFDEAVDILIQFLQSIKNGEEKLVQKEEAPEKETLVKELGLSTRVENILERENVATVKELSNLTAKELKNMKNMGQKSVKEIKTTLKKIGEELNA